jgi:hypothetical protein
MWTADEGPATLEYVGKGRIHVSIDEVLLEALRVRAAKLRCHQSDVITLALQRELSLELFDQTWEDRVGTLEAEPVAPAATPAKTQAEGEDSSAGDVVSADRGPIDSGRPAAALPWRQT